MPTSRSVRSSSARGSTRPVHRKPGLRSARKSLYSTVLALSKIKDDELASIAATVQANKHNIEQINIWEQKRHGLQEASSVLIAGDGTLRSQRLQANVDTI
jgi:hypothetical protein